jgi:hypothetical protein
LEIWRWFYKRGDTFRTGGLFSILGKLFVNSLMQAKPLYHSNHSITQFDTIYINHLRYQFLAILPAGGRSLFWNGPWASLKWLALEENNPSGKSCPESVTWKPQQLGLSREVFVASKVWKKSVSSHGFRHTPYKIFHSKWSDRGDQIFHRYPIQIYFL